MSVQQKIFAACLGFVAIVVALGGLAHQQIQQMGRLTLVIYDHAFVGMSYAERMQADFLRVAAATREGHLPTLATFQSMLDELDVALERAVSPRTRTAGAEARALLVAMPDVPAADLPKWTALADRTITKLVKRFTAEGLTVRDDAEELAAYSGRLVLSEIVAAACLAFGVSLLLGRNLSQPIRQLVRSIGLLAAGELEQEVVPRRLVRRSDEIGSVARATAVFRKAMLQNLQVDKEREKERKKIDAEKRQAAMLELRRLQLLSDISQEILIIHRKGLILQINAAGSRMFGLSDDRISGLRMLDLISEADHPEIMRCMQGEIDPTHKEIHIRAANGVLVPAEFSLDIIDYEGEPANVIALRDLSDRRRNEARIWHLAHHDALTNLPNRFLLREKFASALNASVRSGHPLALLYVDLDHFKPINDLLGHAAGDAVLIQVAKRLLAELRPSDTVARVGGDEFIIIAEVDRPESAGALAARLIDALAQPFWINSHKVEIGVTIGIALCPRDGDGQEMLMHAADTALYCAKHEKRGTFRFFEPAMDEHLLLRKQLERDLQHAAASGQLQLHFQPLVNCVDGEVEGFEALLRWYHPERGSVPPLEFISLAEETGLIVGIGQWVLETACQAAVAWTKPSQVAVNVSPVQFRQSDLPAVVANALARSGLPASRLEIEITEGVLMSDPKQGAEVLSALRGMGVRIALDDFGTGYSSLSYLHNFKFDKLKIDRSFIMRLGEAEDAKIIVRTIVDLAHNLDLKIVAEGVETLQQLAMVRDFQCDQVQGYLLGRPTQTADITELVTARARMLIMACPTAVTATTIEVSAK